MVLASVLVGCSCDDTNATSGDGGSADARAGHDSRPPPHTNDASNASQRDSGGHPPRDGASPGKPDGGPVDASKPNHDAAPPDASTSDVSTDAAVDAAHDRDGGTTRGDGASTSVDGSGGVDASSDATGDGSIGIVPPTTPLVSSSVANGATDVPRTVWIRLDFSDGLDPRAARGVVLDCGAGTPAYDVDVLGKTTLVVNPRAELASAASCDVVFSDATGSQRIHFDVATNGPAAVVPYDRNDKSAYVPFPDDFYLVDDATTRTGHRVYIRVPELETNLTALFDSVLTPTRSLDGMSPLAPIVIALPDVVDPTSVPTTARASTDPFATLALFDVDPASASYLRRVPFDALLLDEANFDGSAAHTLVVFPAIPLVPRGKYAFVVTNRALVAPSRPLEPSAFFTTVAEGRAATEDELRLAPVLRNVFDELKKTSPPIRIDDVALALGITVRSDDDIPKDLLSVRAKVESTAPPSFAITDVAADTTSGSDVAAIVQGTWSTLDWSNGAPFIARDSSGVPTPLGNVTLDFTLALPKTSLTRAAPIVMYQHGQPGNAPSEVPGIAQSGLAKAGFAVIGFTDVANREIIPNGNIEQLDVDALVTLLTDHDLPDYLSLLTHADQLSFLRMMPTLGSVDVLPLGAPDGSPDIDVAAPLSYLGISQGSVHGIGLMAFAPEVHSAALVAGAGRFIATLIHQSSEPLYQGIASVYTTMTRAEFYAGNATVQMDFDRQDPQNLARFVYRSPLDLGVSGRASILMSEGLGDTFVPIYSTRAGAAQLGIVQLEPHAENVPFLSTAAAPLQGNVDASTTAGFFQFVPAGYAAATPSPGCVANSQTEGHYCAQTAAEAIAQRVTFFTTGKSGVPIIVDPTP